MRGLYRKYIVSKADGTLVDEDAKYLVLRLDKGEYVSACRRAALTFSSWIADLNPQLSDDIKAWIDRLDKENPT